MGLAAAAADAAVPTVIPPGGQDQVSGRQQTPIQPPLDRSVTQKPLTDSFTPPVLSDSAAADVQFPLKTIKIQGVSVLPRDKIEAIIAPYRGRTVSLAELQKAANAITRLYAEQGYGLSFAVIPEQDVKDGVVRIVAIEVYIDRITVELKQTAVSLVGRRRIEELLTRRADALRQEFPVKVADIESMLLAINDLPGIRVAATIKRGVRGQGAAQMILEITSEGVSGEVVADNRLKPEFGRYEYSLTGKLRSLAFVGDELGATAVRSAVPHDFDFFSVFYQTPIVGSNTQAFASFAQTSNVASKGTLGLLGNTGRETTINVGVIQPLLRTRSQSLTARASVGAIDATSRFSGQLVASNRVRTVGADLAYDLADPLGGLDQAGASLEQGVSALGAVRRGNLLISPSAATPQYLLSRLRFGRTQSVFGVTVTGTVDGQAALYGLPPSPADCTFGGPDLGKGYDVASFAAEECVRAGLTVSKSFNLFPGLTVTPKAFVDGAVLYHLGRSTLPSGATSQTADSGGLGILINLPYRIAVDTYVTVPFGADAREVSARTPAIWFNVDLKP